ncbi:MAG: hypothetical protein ACE5HT_16345 [Gemmatimonadales bacterium]
MSRTSPHFSDTPRSNLILGPAELSFILSVKQHGAFTDARYGKTVTEVDATYRADLRELNELNFARFDAKLEQRLSALEAKLDTKMSALEARLLRWSFLATFTILGTMIALLKF